jgi:phosphate uptake regulator
VDAFVKQYKYNMDIAPDRTSLSSLEKKDKESIREYAQRWRDLATQVHPPLLDKEMVAIFANMLKASYYEHVIGSSTQQFIDAMKIAERIE